ncbi:hypothetical protein N9K34_02430 [Candidatus Pelagibacter bacterium]|nr:hypothetical protein [Candidatus Pelagibacter bacterium]
MKNNYFYSTRPLVGPYKFIVESCIKNLKKKVIVSVFKPRRFLSLRFNFFFIKCVLEILFFNKNMLSIKYQNIDLSTHILSRTFSDYRSYINNYYYYKNYITNLYHALRIVYSANKLKKNIIGGYIDHGMYLNGILFQIFLKKKITIYSNNLPRGLFKVNYSKKNRNLTYGDFLKFYKSYNLSKESIKHINLTLKKIIYKSQIIPWLKNTKYRKINNINYSKFTHIVYAHSFTDAQLIFGSDGFRNSKDWLLFTLSELLKVKNNKILLKAHPNFYNKSMGKQAVWDKKIFDLLKDGIRENNNLTILDVPIKNHELLKKLNKKTILVSHHSTALLEGIYFGFKCISSKKTFWKCSKLKLTNYWSDKSRYSKILKENWTKLKFAKEKDFNSLLFEYLVSDYNIGGKKYYLTIIKNILRMHNKADIYKLMNTAQFREPSNDIYKKIILSIAKNIDEIN